MEAISWPFLKQIVVLVALAVPMTAGGCARELPFDKETLDKLSATVKQLTSQHSELRQLIDQLRGDLEADKAALAKLTDEVAQLREDVERLKAIPRYSPVVQTPQATAKKPVEPTGRWVQVTRFRVEGSRSSQSFVPPRNPWRVTTRVAAMPQNPASTRVDLMKDKISKLQLKANASQVVTLPPLDRYHIKVSNASGAVIDFLVEYLDKPGGEDDGD
jgi:outer membrane murein-binding lipoprotein Lpp